MEIGKWNSNFRFKVGTLALKFRNVYQMRAPTSYSNLESELSPTMKFQFSIQLQ